jgi:glycerol-3-phosphate dehydrogenase
MIRLGLFTMYDPLGQTQGPVQFLCSIDLHQAYVGVPLKSPIDADSFYSDGWVDDARLVVLNAIPRRGTIAAPRCPTRTRCIETRSAMHHFPLGRDARLTYGVSSATGPAR